jgi:hypothetical protein
MHDRRSESPCNRVGLVKHRELPQHGGAIIKDSLTRKAISLFKGKHRAHWQLDAATGRGESSPSPEMVTAGDPFYDDGFVTGVPPKNVEVEIGQTLHEVVVVAANSFLAPVVEPPGCVVEIGVFFVHVDEAADVMAILSSDMLVGGGKPTRLCVTAAHL